MATVINNVDGAQARRTATLDQVMTANPRILLVDDNAHIHEDFRRVLGKRSGDDELEALGAELFGDSAPPTERSAGFELESAFQGEEALGKVVASLAAGQPYALAFVDVRMPPGWDGVKTTSEMLKTDPNLSIVICSAYSDHTWEEMGVVVRRNRPRADPEKTVRHDRSAATRACVAAALAAREPGRAQDE